MREFIKCNIVREDVQGIPGIGTGSRDEIVYSGLLIKFAGNHQVSYGKHGAHVIGDYTGYAPRGLRKVKIGDTVKGDGMHFKVVAPPRQGLEYTVLDLLLAR